MVDCLAYFRECRILCGIRRYRSACKYRLAWPASKPSLLRDLAAFDNKFTWSAMFVFKILHGTIILFSLTYPFFSLAISLTITPLMYAQASTREEGILQNRGVSGQAFLFSLPPSPLASFLFVCLFVFWCFFFFCSCPISRASENRKSALELATQSVVRSSGLKSGDLGLKSH